MKDEKMKLEALIESSHMPIGVDSVSKFEHYDFAVNNISNSIHRHSMIGPANVMIVENGLFDTNFKSLDKFKKATEDKQKDILKSPDVKFVGLYDNRYKVYTSQQMDPNTTILGLEGNGCKYAVENVNGMPTVHVEKTDEKRFQKGGLAYWGIVKVSQT